MRISTNPDELPYIVLGMDGKLHFAFIDCDECACGIVSWVGTGKETYKQNRNIVIEEKVNKFCANENIIVHSITPSVTMIDNKSSAVMIYTIVYEDLKTKE